MAMELLSADLEASALQNSYFNDEFTLSRSATAARAAIPAAVRLTCKAAISCCDRLERYDKQPLSSPPETSQEALLQEPCKFAAAAVQADRAILHAILTPAAFPHSCGCGNERHVACACDTSANAAATGVQGEHVAA